VQSRRTFLKTAALSAAAAAHLRASSALLNPLSQPKFVNPLRIPGVLDLQSGGFASIAATQFSQWLGLRDGSGSPLPTTVWGYGGSYPGPTILARKNTPVNIEWKNELRSGGTPLPHLLPIDTSIHWADPQHSHGAGYSGPVPIVTHLHGGHTASSSDGHPDAWFTPGAAYTGRLYQQVYQYDHSQDAATLWYHDHAIGITRLNVYAGLAGFYLLRDQEELDAIAANALPSGPYEIGLAIQDRMFTENGQLFYPSEPEEYGQPSPSVLPEFFGDFILVNGVTWPVLDVEPRLYRFRLLNGSDSRFYRLFLSSGQAFLQIGGDSGFLPAPVWMNQLTLGPGERADVILDFRGRTGQSIVMRNVARSPFPKGDVADPRTTGQIMMFRVSVPLGSTPIATLNGNAAHRHCESPAPVAVRRHGLLWAPQARLGDTLRSFRLHRPGHRNARPEFGRSLGHLQHHRGCASHPRAPRAIPGAEPSGIPRHSEFRHRSLVQHPVARPAEAARAQRIRLEGHRHHVPRRSHAHHRKIRPARRVRLALPHPLARGSRDDAPPRRRQLTRELYTSIGL
jgi:FtsP/CotA-like multicopper oxidase with cupredoxin domain